MKLAIMQPYFMPYIGYFQAINAVDKYILYDNLTFIKDAWINRNRLLLCNGTVTTFSVPLIAKSSHTTNPKNTNYTNFFKDYTNFMVVYSHSASNIRGQKCLN